LAKTLLFSNLLFKNENGYTIFCSGLVMVNISFLYQYSPASW